jgi:hypothetical protein
VSACVPTPSSPGCAVVVPPIGAANIPLSTAINSTVNLINTVAANASSPPSLDADTKKTPAGTKDSGDPVTGDKTDIKDEPTKKMYCN